MSQQSTQYLHTIQEAVNRYFTIHHEYLVHTNIPWVLEFELAFFCKKSTKFEYFSIKKNVKHTTAQLDRFE